MPYRRGQTASASLLRHKGKRYQNTNFHLKSDCKPIKKTRQAGEVGGYSTLTPLRVLAATIIDGEQLVLSVLNWIQVVMVSVRKMAPSWREEKSQHRVQVNYINIHTRKWLCTQF